MKLDAFIVWICNTFTPWSIILVSLRGGGGGILHNSAVGLSAAYRSISPEMKVVRKFKFGENIVPRVCNISISRQKGHRSIMHQLKLQIDSNSAVTQ